MAKRVKLLTVDSLVNEIDSKLRQLQIDSQGLTLREKVLRLVEVHYDTRCLGVSVAVESGLSATSAMDRIQVYLQRHVATVIDGSELAVVSGISEYARRVRQLRVERGFRILTGASPDEDSGVNLKPDEYVLVSECPDGDAARRWVVANRIRKTRGSAKTRILKFLRENLNRVVTTEDLAYVAREKREFARRVRELRTEEGYAVATRFTGRPDLRVGEYILLSLDRVAERHDRHIPVEVQREVYERDHNTCRNPACNWSMDSWTSEDPRILELHHLLAHSERGPNTADNLVVLCSRCHDEVHAGRLDIVAIPEL